MEKQGILGSTASGVAENNVINCYSLGEVTGTDMVGNIIGIRDQTNNKAMNNWYTKVDTFIATDLGEAFVDDDDKVILYLHGN